MLPGGAVLPPGGCFLGGMLPPAGRGGGWWRPPIPPGTATAAGGTHPTGMHSCYNCCASSELLTFYCVQTEYFFDLHNILFHFTSMLNRRVCQALRVTFVIIVDSLL